MVGQSSRPVPDRSFEESLLRHAQRHQDGRNSQSITERENHECCAPRVRWNGWNSLSDCGRRLRSYRKQSQNCLGDEPARNHRNDGDDVHCVARQSFQECEQLDGVFETRAPMNVAAYSINNPPDSTANPATYSRNSRSSVSNVMLSEISSRYCLMVWRCFKRQPSSVRNRWLQMKLWPPCLEA
jgi:hypothetical protein